MIHVVRRAVLEPFAVIVHGTHGIQRRGEPHVFVTVRDRRQRFLIRIVILIVKRRIGICNHTRYEHDLHIRVLRAYLSDHFVDVVFETRVGRIILVVHAVGDEEKVGIFI